MPDAAVHPHAVETARWRIPALAHAVVALVIIGETCLSLRFFYMRGLSNLYGDGLAHMEGARRIFDSMTPGYGEIGSVWLPLYHLICAPLAANDFLWRSGLAGGLVSSAAFALTAYLLFRLGAELNRNLAAGVVALSAILLCPDFLYLASTPLTEPLAIFWLTLVAYLLFRYSQSGSWKSLAGAALAAFMGTLTRYEGWYILPVATLLVFFVRSSPWKTRLIHAAVFGGIAGAGPVLWLIHNAYRFQNPLEFYNGPGSAKDIYAHQVATTAFPYPTDGNLLLSGRYYLEDLKLVIGPWALALAVLGLVAWCVRSREFRQAAVALLFVAPLPFYVQAMAHAAVPLYVPTFFPHTYYNLRYGMETIAAVALFPSFIFSPRLGKSLRASMMVIFLAFMGGQFVRMTSAGARELPVVQEGILNTPCRSRRQQAMINFLRGHYDGKRMLMVGGEFPCVIPEVGIYFRNTLTNLNRRYWLKMQTEPQKWVGWIIRSDGDVVDNLMQAHPQAFRDFQIVEHEDFRGEGDFTIYRLQAAAPSRQ